MRRLLSADLRRLMRSPTAWGITSVMAMASAGFVFMQTLSAREVGLERVILLFMSVYGIAAALLLGLLHGGEYSEGILRNKLICGCSRMQVYLSQTAVSALVCAAMYLAPLLTALFLGAPLFDLHVPVGHEMLTILIGLMCCLYYASLYTIIPALCGGRAAAVAANMAVSVGMLMLSVSISEMLVDPAGDGIWRIVLEAMPTGQAVLVNEAAIDMPVRMALLDVCGTVICMGAGVCALHRRDIT